jgi:hypothetical protein
MRIAQDAQQLRMIGGRQQQEGLEDFGSDVAHAVTERTFERGQRVVADKRGVAIGMFALAGPLGCPVVQQVGQLEYRRGDLICPWMVLVLGCLEQAWKGIEIVTGEDELAGVVAERSIVSHEGGSESGRRMVRHRAMCFDEDRPLGVAKRGEKTDQLKMTGKIDPPYGGPDGGVADFGPARAEAGRQQRQHGPVTGVRENLPGFLQRVRHGVLR